MRFRLIFILIIISNFCLAQKVKKEKVRKIKDTVYFVEYNSSIIAGYEGETKRMDLITEQYYVTDKDLFKNNALKSKSQMLYRAEGDWSHGVALAFDKIGLSFGIGQNTQSASDKIKKGSTSFLSFGLSIGGNKWILEAKYRRHKGFYDAYTPNNDSAYYARSGGVYYQQPSLTSDLYKLKFLYFTNHKKFAYKNCYSNSYRQTKTAASWVITANAYYNTLTSDSTIIASPLKNYYENYSNLKGLNVFGCSVYAGVSVNLVIFKHLMWNGTLLIGPEYQNINYNFNGAPSIYISKAGYSIDWRSAIGFNYGKFFTFITGTYDITSIRNSSINVVTDYYIIGFSMGLRIHVKYPKFYQKLQATKLYQLL